MPAIISFAFDTCLEVRRGTYIEGCREFSSFDGTQVSVSFYSKSNPSVQKLLALHRFPSTRLGRLCGPSIIFKLVATAALFLLLSGLDSPRRPIMRTWA